jgi:hypothetical protein
MKDALARTRIILNAYAVFLTTGQLLGRAIDRDTNGKSSLNNNRERSTCTQISFNINKGHSTYTQESHMFIGANQYSNGGTYSEVRKHLKDMF